jgi:eukaryotic-like serine/threonine-protein kinase
MTVTVPDRGGEAVDSIGRYRLERRIGAGSFATVWLGHDDDLDVPVAVKVLADNWADNEDVRNRFLAEARILRRIRDPRLVQVYDIGTVPDGRPYFVMDYINGGSFNDLRKAGCEPVRGLRLAAEACRAIEVLHDNDIIHRDVTPGNLLLSTGPDGQTRVLIADLGVAKSMVDAVGATMTAGTPSYMAPEQAAGVLPLDRRADIYSLTAVT